MEILAADRPELVDAARGLFREYAAEIQADLCFQGFERELAELPGKYAPPAGRLLLGRAAAESWAGCVALRPLAGPACEMKRLYVRPAFRRSGLGRRLAVAVIAAARDIGYARMRLDTLAHMTPAIALYRTLGFEIVPAYYANPLPGATYMELDLRTGSR